MLCFPQYSRRVMPLLAKPSTRPRISCLLRILPFSAAAAIQSIWFPRTLTFVTSYLNNEVLKYDGTTGAFVSVFVSAGSGGLSYPVGLAFGPDGNLYVCSVN